MDDAEYEGLKGRVLALCEYWQKRLGLKWWDIDQTFVRDASEFSTDGAPTPETAANCFAEWRYLRARVSFNMHKIYTHELPDEKLEEVVVHEFCHVLVNEMRGADFDIAHEERVCTTLSKAFIWTRDMARDDDENR